MFPQVPSYVLVGVDNKRTDDSLPPLSSLPAPEQLASASCELPVSIADPVQVPLISLCFGRSGDKGLTLLSTNNEKNIHLPC